MAIEITQNMFVGPGAVVDLANPEINSFNFHLAPDRPGYLYNSSGTPSAQFRNAGTITITLSDPNLSPPGQLIGFGVARTSGTGAEALFHNMETGIFRVLSTIDIGPFGFTKGYFAPQQGVNFLNDGLFEVFALSRIATGIETYDSQARITNNGTIRVEGRHYAEGAYLFNGSVFRNSGLIEVFGGDGAVGVFFGQNIPGFVDGEPTFVNHGTIRAFSDGAPSFGVYVAISLDGGTYLNSGVIAADYAFWINPGEGLASTIPSPETLINHGEIHGEIGLAYGNDILENHGIISGYTDLGEGNDVYAGASGLHFGVVDGGTGDDRLTGGEGAEIFLGQAGRDAIDAGGGDDLVNGGAGSDALDGGAGFDLLSYLDSSSAMTVDLAAGTATGADADRIRNFEAVLGSRFDDRIFGSAADELLEGAGGNDVLDGRGGADDLYGDAGDDELTGGGGDDYFHFSAGDGHDVVTDFTPGGGDDALLVYGYSAYAELRQQGADTLVVLSADDSILLRNVSAATLTAADFLFDPVPLAPSPTPGTGPAQIVNADLLIQQGQVLSFIEPLPVVVASQLFADAGLVIERLTGSLAPSIFVGGLLEVESAAASGVVTGVLASIPDGPYTGRSHISILASGLVEVRATGGADATGLRAPDNVWNAGRLEVGASGGDATGVWMEHELFWNGGTIEVTAAGAATGAYIRNARQAFNSGDIIVEGAAASLGIRFEGLIHPASPDGASVVNSGTIRVTDTTAALDSVGVAIGIGLRGAELWNSGLIEADYAIQRFASMTPDSGTPDIVYNLGELRGIVDLGFGDQAVYNPGIIAGRVQLGLGADRYDGRGGSQSGGVFGEGGADTLIGGAGAEVLDGGEGDDFLSGGPGSDSLTGGAGNDRFHFEAGFGEEEIVDFTAGGGEDSIEVSGYSAYLSLQQEGADTRIVFSASDSILLRGILAGSLTAADFSFSAAALPPPFVIPAAPTAPAAPAVPVPGSVPPPEFLAAGVADAPLTLAGTAGADDLRGRGRGDSLSGGEGGDLLMGYAGDDLLAGEGGDDRLFGGSGADSLDGGTGADRMAGGAGDDLYFADDAADRIVEHDGEGIDEVRSGAAAYALGDHVEILVGLSGSGQSLTGNALANLILGGAGNDRLEGGGGTDILDGGAGADAMAGGADDDLYFVDNLLDQVDELGGEGTDEIRTGLAGYSLAGLAHVENLTGISASGQVLEGNAAGNLIAAGAGADTLRGGAGDDLLDGGFGADSLFGGADNDIYLVAAGDVVTELAGEGMDEVRTSLATYVLADHVERLTGLSAGNQDLRGNALDNVVIAGPANDFLRLQDGGADSVFAGSGNDALYFGAALTGADSADGGEGRDVLAIQGNYAGLSLGAGALVNIETLSLLPSIDPRFGGGSASPFSYHLITIEANVAAGRQLIVNASTLETGESLTFDGSAESDGTFFIYGGRGTDTLTGGSGADIFFFAEGRYAGSDFVDGGGGADILVLRGDYALTLGAGSMTNIETVTLMSASDTRFFQGGSNYNYAITTHDGNVATGATMTFNGGKLQASEVLNFDGSAESGGHLRVFGGNAVDSIRTGGGNDFIYGGLEGDYLSSGGGADIFSYRSALEATGWDYDRIEGFDFSQDKLDLAGVHDGFGRVDGGLLRSFELNEDLAAAMNGVLTAGKAVFFAPNAGSLAGTLFLVVDQNGVEGYQAGEDYVFQFLNTAPPPAIPDFIV